MLVAGHCSLGLKMLLSLFFGGDTFDPMDRGISVAPFMTRRDDCLR